jgi:hypothetical protein
MRDVRVSLFATRFVKYLDNYPSMLPGGRLPQPGRMPAHSSFGPAPARVAESIVAEAAR